MADTPLMKQYKEMKSQYSDMVLFFRLGDFYEMFDEDAKEVSALLNLTLTHRGDSPMCGIPYHAAKNYIKRLLDCGKKIAICEQMELSENSKALARREVVRIVTPATVVDEDFLDDKSFNYIICFFQYALAFCDVSTGDFHIRALDPKNKVQAVRSVLQQLSPREILVCEDEYFLDFDFKAAIDSYPAMVTKLAPWYFSQKGCYKILCEQAKVKSLAAYGLKDNDKLVCPAGALIRYITETSKSSVDKRQQLIETHKFDCKYLICTSALDVGFSIEDEAVKDMVCTFTPDNWTNIIQSIGRKRQVDKNDKVTLHIQHCSQAQINKLLDRNAELYEHLNFYRKNGELAYMKEYRKKYDKNRLIVTDYRLLDDGTLQVYIKEDKFVLTLYEYQKKILQEIKKCGSYADFLKDKLRITDDVTIRHKRKDDYIDTRLREIAAEGIIYTSDNLDELTTRMNVKSNGKKRKLLKRPSAINKRLQEMEKPFEIKITEDEQRHKLYQLVFTGQDE